MLSSLPTTAAIAMAAIQAASLIASTVKSSEPELISMKNAIRKTIEQAVRLHLNTLFGCLQYPLNILQINSFEVNAHSLCHFSKPGEIIVLVLVSIGEKSDCTANTFDALSDLMQKLDL